MENIKSETTGQKRIDTIATDIKNLVAGISNGKPANVTEENMDKFLTNIKEAFNSWNNPIREKDGKLRMSVQVNHLDNYGMIDLVQRKLNLMMLV